MTHPPFRINEVLDNCADNRILPGPCRVLGYDFVARVMWLIALPSRQDKRPLRHRDYLKQPFTVSFTDGSYWRDQHMVYSLQLKAAAELQMTEANMLTTAGAGKAARVKRDLEKRDIRFQIVATALSREGDSNLMMTANEALNDRPRLLKGLQHAAKKFCVSRTTARHLVHLFWAGGSQVNALLPKYGFCGLPGHAKTSAKKLGRPSRSFKHGISTSNGHVMTEQDKEHLAWGYTLVNAERTLHDAYLLTCSRYWATHDVSAAGIVSVTLNPAEQRPTFPQFIYWGRKLVKQKVRELLMQQSKLRQLTYASGGSVQDQVSMAGQLGCFDATSTDLYLASLRSRLKKLPAMTRSILKDIRTDLIIGLYCGWDAPSPATALKTVLNAVGDKVAYCARFGITITPDDWPSFLPRTILADNGELKGRKPSEAERQFNFGIEYTPVHRGDRKGSIETQHHTDHKKLDHKIQGSTKGKKRERGEQNPVVEALWNYHEYMGELIRHVLDHNNVQEVPDLAPTDMLLKCPDVKPTRLNIYKWLVSRNMMVDVPVDVEIFRAFTLPDWPAVLHKNGVYIKANVLGRQIRMPRLRYSGKALISTGLMSQVKQSNRPMDVTVKLDQEDLSRTWLVTPQGLIEMQLQVKDSTFIKKMTMTDWVGMIAEATLKRDSAKSERDQYDLDRVLRREAISISARKELREEEKARGGRPSKQSLKKDLRANMDSERLLLESLHAQSKQTDWTEADMDSDAAPAPPQARSGMRSIMDALNEEARS